MHVRRPVPVNLPWLIKDTYIIRAAVATRGVSLVRFRSLTRLPRVATRAAYEGVTAGTAGGTEDGRDPLHDHGVQAAERRWGSLKLGMSQAWRGIGG